VLHIDKSEGLFIVHSYPERFAQSQLVMWWSQEIAKSNSFFEYNHQFRSTL